MTGRPVLHPADKTGSRAFTFNGQASFLRTKSHRKSVNNKESLSVCLCVSVCVVHVNGDEVVP